MKKKKKNNNVEGKCSNKKCSVKSRIQCAKKKQKNVKYGGKKSDGEGIRDTELLY